MKASTWAYRARGSAEGLRREAELMSLMQSAQLSTDPNLTVCKAAGGGTPLLSRCEFHTRIKNGKVKGENIVTQTSGLSTETRSRYRVLLPKIGHSSTFSSYSARSHGAFAKRWNLCPRLHGCCRREQPVTSTPCCARSL